MKRLKIQWKKILSVVCALALLVELIATSPSLFAKAADIDTLSSAITSASYTAAYAQTETVDMATATAIAKVQAVVDAQYEGATVSLTGTPTMDRTVKGGTFTFAVTVTAGTETFTVENLTMNIDKRPQPVKMVFDSETAVTGAHMVYNTTDGFSKSFKEENGRKYMHITQGSASSTFEQTILGFGSQTIRLDMDAYPYMKISYRRNVSSTLYNEKMAIMVCNSDADTQEDYYGIFTPYKISGTTEPYWEQMVTDMRTSTITYYQEAAGTSSEGTMQYLSDAQSNWTGITNRQDNWWPLRIDLTRHGNGYREVDIEYIAFFASREEAEAFPTDISSDVALDQQALKEAQDAGTFACNAGEASSESMAQAKLSSMLSALELTSTYTIEKVSYTAATKEEAGTYVANVVFDETHISTVTLNIKKMANSMVLAFNSATMAQRFKGWNATAVFEDGYVKLTRTTATNGDGFQLSGNLEEDEKFTLGDLPYMKVKYKISGASAAGKQQLYLWSGASETGNNNLYQFYAHDGLSDGDEVTLLLDLSETSTSEAAVQISNLTKDKVSSINWYYTAIGLSSEQDISSLRFNLSRFDSGTPDNPTIYIEYIGFFPTKEKAEAFEGVAQEGMNAAKEYLQNHSVSMNWGAGNTEPKAMEKLNTEVEKCGVGVVISNATYTVPTDEAEGKIVYDVTLTNAGLTETLTGLTATIAKKPTEPIMWRFNNEEIVEKLTFASVKASVEDNLLKMVGTDPFTDDNFMFYVDAEKMGDTFRLEDYPYIQMKYRRVGVAPAQLFFSTDESTNLSFGPSLGLGPWDSYWYTSTINATINGTDKVYEEPHIYNYNHDKQEYENYTRNINTKSSGKEAEFVGLAKQFRFNFSRRKFVDRTAEVEYIAFFPTLEDALNYYNDDKSGNQAEKDRLASNAQVALESYTLPSVKYYDGSTKDDAVETATELLSAVVGDDVTVQVDVNTATYTAPTLSGAEGSLKFTAKICDKNGNVLFTTESYNMVIEGEADTTPNIFTFSNPDFVQRVSADKAEVKDYKEMDITGANSASFTLDITNEEKFHLAGSKYVALQASASGGTVSLVLNDKEYTLDSWTSGTKLIVDLSSLEGVDLTRVTKLGLKFSASSATVTYIGFFHTEDEAVAYTGASDTLNAAVATLNNASLVGAYADGKTENEALAYAQHEINDVLEGKEATIVKAEVTGYTKPTTTAVGAVEVKVLLRAGSEQDSHYQEVTVTMSLGEKPSAPIVWKFDATTVNTLTSGHNINLTSENGILKATTKDGSLEDGYNFYFKPSDMNYDFYLQDYPYIKIKMKASSTTPTDAGTSTLYIYSDESSGHPSKSFTLTTKANDGKWCTTLMDINENTSTISDLESNVLVKSDVMGGTVDYHGKAVQFRLDIKRHITYERTAEIEYIGFFSSREEAEAYERDYHYDTYNFNGKEYAKAEDALSTAPLTIESGFKTSKKETMTLVANQVSDADKYFSLETTEDGNVRFVYAGEELLKSSELAVCDGEWHHVAVSLGTDKAVLYVDGKNVAEATDFAINSELSLAAPVLAKNTVSGNAFIGDLYYVRMYSQTLTESQIQSNAFCKENAIKKNLLAGWFTDDLSSQRQFADVNKKNPATLTDNYGKLGHEFLGNDYVKTEKSLTAAPKTFEFWMKSNAATAGQNYTILSNKSDTNATYYVAIDMVDGQLVMNYGGTQLFATTDLTLNDNIWRHIAITLDGTSKITLYVDGTVHNTYNVEFSSTQPVLSAYYIGSGLETEKTPFVGHLSDVRIWSDEKSADTILQNQKNCPEKNAENLLGAWRLDTQEYLQYTDYSANENIGTLYSKGWYKLENITGDYTIAQLGDTQSYFVDRGTTIKADPLRFVTMYEGLAKNAERFNILHLLHAGDVTQNSANVEWDYAQRAHEALKGVIPYSIIMGNHDYPSPSSGLGAEYRDSTAFSAAFTLDELKGQYDLLDEKYGSYGGRYEGAGSEGSSENIYSLLTVGEGENIVEYMLFALEAGPRDSVLKWVSDVLTANPNKRAIIMTHAYLTEQGERQEAGIKGAPETWGADFAGENDYERANAATEVWDELIKQHDNIVMVTCGHSQNKTILYNTPISDKGYEVIELMMDHSAMVTGFPSKEGLLTLMSFTNDGKMHTYWYSPIYDAFYDTGNEVTFDMSNALFHNYIMGDADLDTTLTVKDIVRMKKDINDQKKVADAPQSNICKDDVLDQLDVTKLRQWLIGLRNEK